MIVYFDTSAFVPLLVSEPGTPVCWQLWRQADAVVSSRLLYVESAAALAQALRLGRITKDGHQAALHSLGTLWLDFEVVEPGWPVVREPPRWRTSARCGATTRCTARPRN